MNTRVREQLEGALQVALVGFVLAVAVVGSHIYPWNTPSVRPVRTFALVEFMVLAVAYAVIARARLRLLPGVVVVGALTVVALLSTAWSASPGLTVERGLGFAALIAAGAALALTAVDRPRLAGYLMLAVLAATVLIALGGLVELWHAYEHAVLPATRGQAARYNGIGQNPNQIAMLIALTLPIALWAAGRSRGWARVAAWGATLLLTGSLAASGSRGAVVAAFAGCLVYVVAAPRRRRILAAGVLTVAFVAVVGATRLPQPAEVNPPLYENFGRTPKLAPRDLNGGLPLDSEVGFPGENREAGIERTLFFSSGRAEAWGFAIEQGLRRPVVGYGFGTEDETFVDRTYLFVSDVVENSFIGMFLQLGAVGVALVVGALALVLAAWLRARRRLTPETADDAAACAGVVVAGVVLAVPQSYLTSVGSPPTAPFWLALCLLAALSYRRAAA